MFSIVIPTYNRIGSLIECLNSIDRQKFDVSKFEVIIVDDGSDVDVSQAISLSNYRFKYSVIRINHSGPAQARNKGVNCAVNDFIIFFEDDVVVDENYLKSAYSILAKSNYDVLEGKTILLGTKSNIRLFDDSDLLSFIPCNLVVRRDLFIKLGGYDTSFYDYKMKLYFREDADLGFRLLKYGASVLKKDELIVEHPQQFQNIRSCFRHARRYYFDPLLYKKHPEYYRKFIERKKILGIPFRRPINRLFWSMVVMCLILIFGLLKGIYSLICSGILGILILSFVIEFKYKGFYSKKFWKFFVELVPFSILPFYYFYYLVKGCVKFRSYGCLV